MNIALLTALMTASLACNFSAAGSEPYPSPATHRREKTINREWTFNYFPAEDADSRGCEAPAFDDSAWPAIAIPHTWHTCETTHCRAGWVVHLAGEAGYELERRTSALFAAQQIYKASGYEISPVRFFDSNEDAMADMKKLAEVSQ